MTMPIVISVKRCPECRKMIGLQALECNRCGHVFRTRFTEPSDRTEAFDAVLLPRMPIIPTSPVRRSAPLQRFRQTFGPAILGSFLLASVLGAGGWLVWSNGLFTAPPAAMPATYASLHAPQTAEGLYKKITIPMSLYDLDQTAGGTGRVLHSSNPNTLILAYDFPDQSVRVSLARVDAAIADYQVQAVALYRGKTLLLKHVAENEWLRPQ